jgi:hypothetical protein
MAAPGQMLTEVVDNPLCSPVGLWRNGKINTGDLRDLHGMGDSNGTTESFSTFQPFNFFLPRLLPLIIFTLSPSPQIA